MRRAELVTACVLALFSIYLMWKAGQPAWEGIPWWDNVRYVKGEGPGSGFWPFYLAAIMLICSVWIIVNWVRRVSPPSRSEDRFLDSYGIETLIKVGGGVFMLIFTVSGLSFLGIDFPDLTVDDRGYPVMELAMLWKLPIGTVLKGGGMYLAIGLFLAYYIYFLGRHRMFTVLAVSIGAPIATFFFFDVAMRIVLPKGYLEPFFIPLYDAFL